MQIVVAPNGVAPESYSKSLFLAGPSPRDEVTHDWRQDALKILEQKGYDGVVFTPTPLGGYDGEAVYEDQIEWEHRHMQMADIILFWVPRNDQLPGFTTNVEFGQWYQSGKVVYGHPVGAPKMRYLDDCAHKEGIFINSDLNSTITEALYQLGTGDLRVGGEREVPLHIWQTKHFQSWLQAQKQTGNRLDGATVVWTFRVGAQRQFVFFWALHVNVFIASENRHKINEVVISRTDIATIVAWHSPAVETNRFTDPLMNTDIVLIKEFRSPASTKDGYIREVPGGSSFKEHDETPEQLAAHEMEEETGLVIPVERFQMVSYRQVAGTLSAHKALAFSVELKSNEIEFLKKQTGPHGIEADSERTYVEVTKLGHLLRQPSVDWANIGMIFEALMKS